MINGFNSVLLPIDGKALDEGIFGRKYLKQTILIGKYPLLEHPIEVIEMIFKQCEKLLELTVVCPTFNDIISQSSLLMKKLKVYDLSTATHTELLKSDRKYGRLNLYYFKSEQWPQVNSFIEKHKRTLVDVLISRFISQFETWQYFEILSALSCNLKKLKVCGFPDPIIGMGILEFPNLEELTWDAWNGDMLILKEWKTPKLRKFAFLEPQIHGPATNLVRFLRDKPQLQDLEIDDKSHLESFLSAAGILPFSFNLVKLRICLGYFINQKPQISPFLQSQKESLKVLAISRSAFQGGDFHQILTLQLEELHLIEMDYRSVSPTNLRNQTIKKLTLSLCHFDMTKNHGVIHVLEACIGVETLYIQEFQFPTDLVESIAATLPKLPNLDLSKIDVDFTRIGLSYILVWKHFRPNITEIGNSGKVAMVSAYLAHSQTSSFRVTLQTMVYMAQDENRGDIIYTQKGLRAITPRALEQYDARANWRANWLAKILLLLGPDQRLHVPAVTLT